MAFDISDIDGGNGFKIMGFLQNGQLGYSVAGLGDINADGIDDIILGAPYVFEQTNLETVLAGRSFVVFGSAAGFDTELDLSMLDGINGFSILRMTNARSGWAVSSAGDFNGDGINDFAIGSPSANAVTAGKVQAGQTHIVYGSAGGFAPDLILRDLTPQESFLISGRKAGDRSGHSVANAGDFNGDGIDDIIIGAPFDEILMPEGPFVNSTGGAYVVYGSAVPTSGELDIAELRSSTGLQIFGTTSSETAGRYVAGAGDVNGDGFDDVFVGTRIGLNDGRGHIVFGAAFGLHDQMLLSELGGVDGFTINGVTDGDDIGSGFAAAGDLNGDGVDDFVIAAPNKDNSANAKLGSGAVYVVYGSTTGFPAELDLTLLDGTNGYMIVGEDALDRLGSSLAAAGDVNGDGLGDLLIGAEDADRPGTMGKDAGAAYILFGTSAAQPAMVDLAELEPKTGLKIIGENIYAENFGTAVAAAGDINNDGFADVLIGAPTTETISNNEGAAFVVYGGRNIGYLGSSGMPPDGGAPDLDNDGFDDILFVNNGTREVGQFEMPAATWSGIGLAGTGWEARGSGRFDGNDFTDDILWFKPSTGDFGRFDMVGGVLDSWQGIAIAGAGWDVAGTGDFNGDGIDDILWLNEAEATAGQFRLDASGMATWHGITSSGAGWEVMGTGDFNGDGIDDVLWFNDATNTLGQYQMSATGFNWQAIGVPSTGYEVVGTGDFAGDNADDILVFHAGNRELGYFDMSSGGADWVYLGNTGTGWSVVGTGDFNNDGMDDILWRHQDGRLGQYQMDGAAYSWEAIGVAGPEWEVLL